MGLRVTFSKAWRPHSAPWCLGSDRIALKLYPLSPQIPQPRAQLQLGTTWIPHPIREHSLLSTTLRILDLL